MANVYRLKEIHVNSESSFCENAESPSSNTFDTRIPALNCTVTLDHPWIEDMGYRSRMNEQSLSNRGVRSCSLEIETHLPCHYTTTAGALASNWAYVLLGHGLGGSSAAMVGTTLSGASSASSFTLTSTSGLAVGMIGAVGDKTDARGNGQCYVVSAVGPPTTSYLALPATPQNGDVAYAMLQAYHDESTASTGLTTKRFMVGHSSSPTAGEQFQLLGCQLAGLKFNFPFDGRLPTVTWSYRGAYWQRSAQTIPSVLTLGDHYTSPAAGGSWAMGSVGSTTRVDETPSSVELDLELGLEPLYGPTGKGSYQNILGWQRTSCKPRVTFQIPWKADYETWFDTANQSLTAKQFLLTTNGVDGRRFAVYLPNCVPIGNRPSNPVEVNGQTYVPVSVIGRDLSTASTEISKSAIRFGLG
jgi:hypothetical protein